MGHPNHLGDQLGALIDRCLRGCQAALHGAVKVGAGGELTESLIDGKKVLRNLKHGGINGAGLQSYIHHVARAQRKKRNLLLRNLVGEKNLAGESFGQGAERCDAELFAAHLLEVGDAWRSEQIEGWFVAHSEDDPHIDAAYRCDEIDAAGQHRRNCLGRFHKNKFGLQTLFSEIAAVAGDNKRHIQDAARNIADAHRRQFRGFFS